MPAAPNIPAPMPACLPFSAISAFASSSSWRTRVVVSCESCLSSSPIGRSRRSPPPFDSVAMSLPLARGREAAGSRRAARDAGGRAAGVMLGRCDRPVGRLGRCDRPVGRLGRCRHGTVPEGRCASTGAGLARAVPLTARRLEEPRRREAEREPAGDHRPRLPPGEVLDVAQDPVGVRLAEVAAAALGALGGLVRQLGRRVLALLAELLADRAQVGGGRLDLPAEPRGALVDLVAHASAGLVGGLAGLLARLVGRLANRLARLAGRLRGLLGRGSAVLLLVRLDAWRRLLADHAGAWGTCHLVLLRSLIAPGMATPARCALTRWGKWAREP